MWRKRETYGMEIVVDSCGWDVPGVGTPRGSALTKASFASSFTVSAFLWRLCSCGLTSGAFDRVSPMRYHKRNEAFRGPAVSMLTSAKTCDL
jgi:hypothetical protein